MNPQHQNSVDNTASYQSRNTYDHLPLPTTANSLQFSSFSLHTRYGSSQTAVIGTHCAPPSLHYCNINPIQTIMKSNNLERNSNWDIHSSEYLDHIPPYRQQQLPYPNTSITNQFKLPSIRELLNEIESTIHKEDLINDANTNPKEISPSLSIKEMNFDWFQIESVKNNHQIFTTTQNSISNSNGTENTSSGSYNSNCVHKGISSFGNKKICKQKSTRYLSDTANLILKQWLYENWHNPYPDQSDKQNLSKLANITVGQVNNYFINARRRICKKFKNPPSSIHALP